MGNHETASFDWCRAGRCSRSCRGALRRQGVADDDGMAAGLAGVSDRPGQCEAKNLAALDDLVKNHGVKAAPVTTLNITAENH